MPEKTELMLNAIRLILRPIIRLCIRHSIKLQEIIEMIKLVLVQVAREELEKENEQCSASRISVITGVHRKDVTRIEKSQGKYNRPDNPIAKVMTQWQCDPRYTTKAGKPKVLHCEGKQSEFAELVASVNGKDVSSYSVLFEMERMGIVEKTGSRLKLKGRDFIHGENLENGLALLASDTDDLISSVEENLFNESSEQNLHLRTEFDRVPLEHLTHAKKWVLEEGSQFHKRVRKFLSSLDLDTNPSLAKNNKRIPCGRISVGSFSIAEELNG